MDTKINEPKYDSFKQLKRISDLIEILEFPSLYLDNFFLNLINKIDIDFNEKQVNSDDKEGINRQWEQIIDQIKNS